MNISDIYRYIMCQSASLHNAEIIFQAVQQKPQLSCPNVQFKIVRTKFHCNPFSCFNLVPCYKAQTATFPLDFQSWAFFFWQRMHGITGV